MYVLRVIHNLDRLIEANLYTTDRVMPLLDELHKNRPADYGRLMRYKQCRLKRDGNTEFWTVLTRFDMDTVAIIIRQELESYGYGVS